VDEVEIFDEFLKFLQVFSKTVLEDSKFEELHENSKIQPHCHPLEPFFSLPL
jgi:hypothetical protein